MSDEAKLICNTCNATLDIRQRHACPDFDHEAMAARIDALASALAVANARLVHLEHRVDSLVGDLQ